MKMDLETKGIGGRHRDNSHHFAAESEALDQIAKEAEARLAARRQARYEARNIRMKEIEKKQKEEEDNQANHTNHNHVPHPHPLHPDGVRLRDEHRRRDQRSYSSRRSSTDSSEEGINLNIRDLKNELKDLEEKFRKAMVNNAGLDNEKSALTYQVELLKDQMEECEEQS